VKNSKRGSAISDKYKMGELISHVGDQTSKNITASIPTEVRLKLEMSYDVSMGM
jgi:hypothetical protein